jgi:hypothetical protein
MSFEKRRPWEGLRQRAALKKQLISQHTHQAGLLLRRRVGRCLGLGGSRLRSRLGLDGSLRLLLLGRLHGRHGLGVRGGGFGCVLELLRDRLGSGRSGVAVGGRGGGSTARGGTSSSAGGSASRIRGIERAGDDLAVLAALDELRRLLVAVQRRPVLGLERLLRLLLCLLEARAVLDLCNLTAQRGSAGAASD